MARHNRAPEVAQFILFRDDSNEVENGDFFMALKILKMILAFAYREPGCFSVCGKARQLS